uniref:heparosan-N-sulfate-glucuronate 5-epimerase n=1 Tax=Clastoptera arizonana TaxID=38151 RepID=A0A1B6CJP8_9HEMI
MRLNLKISLVCLSVTALFITLSVWTRCGSDLPNLAYHFQQAVAEAQEDPNEHSGVDTQGFEELDCNINGDYTISCRREGDEIYLPFSFLHKYFDVYGKLATYDGYERFEWSHSYSKVYNPKSKYEPRSVFLYFENYNVELRERVKCISAINGVPVSTQWESQGYYYPTQIAQFGLSHYSKNLTEPEPRRKVLEDGSSMTPDWIVDSNSVISRSFAPEYNSKVLRYQSDTGIKLMVDTVLDFVLSLDLKLSAADNSSFIVVLQSREKKQTWNLHYICSQQIIFAKDQDIYYGLGCDQNSSWLKLTRDLLVDLQKGLSLQNKVKRKISKVKLKVASIILKGSGMLDNLTIASSEHMANFYAAAHWFVENQDVETGGWPNSVRRRGAPGMNDLMPGWLSAMGQGHGISVLARAYYHSGGDKQYLNAALRALRPFRIPSKDGGVLASFLGQIPWYEEYPTQPSSFVLNGFIYSLIGLYDLLTLAPSLQAREATVLFQQGMKSLKKLLLAFDNGSGTNYDLRHLTLGSAPNIARWDYHATHVNQLLLLATIDKDPLLSTTAMRWVGYMSGKRAAHN